MCYVVVNLFITIMNHNKARLLRLTFKSLVDPKQVLIIREL